MHRFQLTRSVRVLFFLFLLFGGLYFARTFLVPLVLAALLALLFLPLCIRLEKRKIPKGLAAGICILIFIACCTGVTLLLWWQIGNVAEDAQGLQAKVQEIIQQFRLRVEEKFGVSQEKQDEMIENSAQSGSGNVTTIVTTVLGSLFGFVVDMVLVLAYTFIFLYARGIFYNFILQLRSPAEQEETKVIIHNIQKVSQQYISGLAIMIACLWVMYGIGFSIIGVEHALFFAMLCGVLELIPFVGNFTGNLITVLMGIMQGGGMPLVIKIACTYATVQFLQTYFLEPLVVGKKVKINAFATIAGLVLGELLWGIAGLLLAIPLMGITKIVCAHIPGLEPYATLIGGTEKKEKKKRRSFFNLKKK
ncbi:MAG: AI-2E family transporter [Chitinophagales bacterium]|nr:AI-2E family transporter [Chitinophagales bacterium]